MYSVRIGIIGSLILIMLAGRVESAENKMERWYTYWGLGIANTTWPAPLDEAMDLVAAMPGVSRTRLGMDLLGIYGPINPNLMVGVVINAAGDRLEDEQDSMQINLYTYAASAQYFFKEIGSGLFCRGDLGMASANLLIDDNDQGTTESGLGILVGVGYAHPITSGTRIALNLNYATRSIEGDSWNTLGISLGGLF